MLVNSQFLQKLPFSMRDLAYLKHLRWMCRLNIYVVRQHTGWFKNGTILYALSSSNINRFSKSLHCQN